MRVWVRINMGDVQLESGPFAAIQHEMGGGLQVTIEARGA
jgi:hypothetical protein